MKGLLSGAALSRIPPSFCGADPEAGSVPGRTLGKDAPKIRRIRKKEKRKKGKIQTDRGKVYHSNADLVC